MRWSEVSTLVELSLCAALIAATIGCNKLVAAGSAEDVIPDASTSALTRESHGMYFPIGLGSYHPTETCDDCHGGFSTYTQFTCMSCHAHETDVAAMRHTFITGF